MWRDTDEIMSDERTPSERNKNMNQALESPHVGRISEMHRIVGPHNATSTPSSSVGIRENRYVLYWGRYILFFRPIAFLERLENTPEVVTASSHFNAAEFSR